MSATEFFKDIPKMFNWPKRLFNPEPPLTLETYSPSIIAEAIQPEEFSELKEGVITVKDQRAVRFYLEWNRAAEECLDHDQHPGVEKLTSWMEWQDFRQQSYLEKAHTLSDLSEIRLHKRSYLASDAMRLWQMRCAERACLAAMTDRDLVGVLSDGHSLSNEEWKYIGRRLIRHQLDAHQHVAQMVSLPDFEIVDLGKGRGGIASGDENYIHMDETAVQQSGSYWTIGAVWHEGYHIIQHALREILDKEEGQDLLHRHNLLTETKISKWDIEHYVPLPWDDVHKRIVTDSQDYNTYLLQSVESGVRVSESMGQIFLQVISGYPGHHWSLGDAVQRMGNMPKSFLLQHTNDEFNRVALLEYKLRHGDSLHQIFRDWREQGLQVECAPLRPWRPPLRPPAPSYC